MTSEQAVELARLILAVATASNADRVIHVTGHVDDKEVTVIRMLK
jgi:hypothetical protein